MRTSPLRWLIAVAFLLQLFPATGRAQPMTSWSVGPTMPFAGSQMLAIAGDDGSIYLFGGYRNNGQVSADAWRFDLVTGNYTQLTSMSSARRGACGDRLPDGRLMVVGGYNNGPVLTAVIYDTHTDVWTPAGSVTGGWECSANTGADGLLHVFGGESNTTSHDVYDPGTDSWSAGQWMPTQRKIHGSAMADDGRFFVFGGEISQTTDVFDPQTQVWAQISNLPNSNMQFGWAGDGERMFVLGGSTSYGNDGAPYYDVVWYADTITGVWQVDSEVLPVAARETTAAVVDGVIYLFGGSNGNKLDVVQVGVYAADQDEDG